MIVAIEDAAHVGDVIYIGFAVPSAASRRGGAPKETRYPSSNGSFGIDKGAVACIVRV